MKIFLPSISKAPRVLNVVLTLAILIFLQSQQQNRREKYRTRNKGIGWKPGVGGEWRKKKFEVERGIRRRRRRSMLSAGINYPFFCSFFFHFPLSYPQPFSSSIFSEKMLKNVEGAKGRGRGGWSGAGWRTLLQCQFSQSGEYQGNKRREKGLSEPNGLLNPCKLLMEVSSCASFKLKADQVCTFIILVSFLMKNFCFIWCSYSY